MARWQFLLVPILGAATIALPAATDTPAIQPVQVTSTEHVDFAPGGTVHLNNVRGSVVVEGWDQPQVEVTTVKSMGFDPGPAPQTTHALDSVHVVTGPASNGQLTISTSRARIHNRFTHALGFGRDPDVEYRIRVPRNTNLVVDHADGYVSVTGLTGNIEADNRRGDIVLMLPDLAAYSINARTKIGVVTSDLAGSMHQKHLTGETFSHGDTSLAHKLQLRMGFGGITIKELAPEALAAAK